MLINILQYRIFVDKVDVNPNSQGWGIQCKGLEKLHWQVCQISIFLYNFDIQYLDNLSLHVDTCMIGKQTGVCSELGFLQNLSPSPRLWWTEVQSVLLVYTSCTWDSSIKSARKHPLPEYGPGYLHLTWCRYWPVSLEICHPEQPPAQSPSSHPLDHWGCPETGVWYMKIIMVGSSALPMTNKPKIVHIL